MIARLTTAAVVAVSVVALGLLTGSATSTANEPAPAKIVFSNGGRIIEIDAAGRGRHVLTDDDRIPGEWDGPVGDIRPRVSPDGRKLLFTREVATENQGWIRKVMVSRRDGSRARAILTSDNGPRSFGAASWTPAGRVIVPSDLSIRRKYWQSIISVSASGGGRRTIFKLPLQIASEKRVPLTLGLPEMSPDGSRLLVQIWNVLDDGRPSIEVADLAAGKRTLISKKATSAVWSPDGKAIALAVDGGRPTCDGDYCSKYASDIAVATADGKRLRRVVKSPADESQPAFSPDGSRIAFSSDRNYPRHEDAMEIYSVQTDGGCMTWLTNGSPASTDPSWSGGPGSESAPGACGDSDRPALVEVEPKPLKGVSHQTQLWPGPRVGPLLLSRFDTDHPQLFVYGDCANYSRSDCQRPETQFSSESVCYFQPAQLSLFTEGVITGSRKGRPVGNFHIYGQDFSLMIAGRTWVYASSPGRGDIAFRYRMFDGLRLLGSDRPLPKAGGLRLPGRTIRYLRKVRRLDSAESSVAAAADRMGVKPSTFRVALKADRFLRRFAPLKSTPCPRSD